MIWDRGSRRRQHAVDTAPWPPDGAPASDVAATRSRRMARLGAGLAEDGIVWPDPMVPGDDAARWLETLDAWTALRWPGLMRGDDLVPEAFDRREWPGGAVGAQFTAVADVGFAVADIARALRPDLVWAVDAYMAHIVDGVGTAGRIVLVDPAVPLDAQNPEVVAPFGTAMLRAMQFGFRDPEPHLEPLREGLRPMLWFSHRHLFD